MNVPQPGRAATALALAALLVAAAVNWHHLGWWCLPLLLVGIGLHLRAAMPGRTLPKRGVRLALTLLVPIAVLLTFRTLNGLAAGATLLAAMTVAKLFEARASRDWYVICGATLFLLLAACLDRQQIWRLPVYALCLWLCAGALRGLAGGAALPAGTLLREAARQLLFALPLAIMLFLFFPRLPGAFWSLPGDDAAVTGLSDEMSPGNIARLTESDEPALRARFDGALPPARERYWRGPVLHDFNGLTWRRHRGEPAPSGALQYRGPAYRYSVTVEPNTHGTVLALELASPPDAPFTVFTDDYQLLARRPLLRPQSFNLTGYPQAVSREGLSATARRMDLALPVNRNPRTQELATRLRSQAADDASYIASVLTYLHDGGFEYTLTPQRLGPNSVDDFLFSTRQGFCGHYASAFVVLMRAGGVPARVVTGYQGGEWNPIGGYLTVRQSDAHAWAEVWLPERGWTRTDPTSVVAPERLSPNWLHFGAGLSGRHNPLLRGAPWLASAFQAWDALNAWWQDDIVGFNFAKQIRLADWLGFGDGDWHTLTIALGAGLGLWLLWLASAVGWWTGAARPDALARGWARIERRLARGGHMRASHEGVLGFCERLSLTQPELIAELAPLARCYAQLRYGPPPTATEMRDFLKQARAFRLPASRTNPG